MSLKVRQNQILHLTMDDLLILNDFHIFVTKSSISSFLLVFYIRYFCSSFLLILLLGVETFNYLIPSFFLAIKSEPGSLNDT